MTSGAPAGPKLRPLREEDLDAVVAIDRSVMGRPRIAFYERRLAALDRQTGGFAAFAAEREGGLTGFVLARISDGEFGGDVPEAALDAIGVAAGARGQGIGGALLAALTGHLRARGVPAIATEADWRDAGLTGFFARAGFSLSPHIVLERRIDGAPGEPDGGTGDDDTGSVRSLRPDDLPALLRIDRRITGRDRRAHYERKLDEAMRESAVQVSLVAEVAGEVAGFIMARVDFGAYGAAEPAAVMDTIAVEPAEARRGVAGTLLSQLLTNLRGLRVERLRTRMEWTRFDLAGFLDRNGFHPGNRIALRCPLD